MANSERRITPSEFVDEVIQNVPEIRRDEARQLQKSQESLEGQQWESQKERYDVARWLAKGLLWTFSFIIAWSGLLVLVLLVLSAFSGTGNIVVTSDMIDMAADFVKDLLPFVGTPLGVALGFYFREME